MADRAITRRDFMRTGVAAGVAAGLAPSGARGASKAGKGGPEPWKKTRSHNENMEYRRLGKTGMWVSAVCLGGHWKRINKIIGEAKTDVGSSRFEQNRHDVISHCLNVGINYVDACMGREILAYAKALRGRREQMYFGFSWSSRESRHGPWRSTAKLLEGFDRGLLEAGLEYVDLWRITMHERGRRHTGGEVEQMIAALEKAKKQGKCRHTGFSSHDRTWIKVQVEKYPEQVEAILTPYTASSKELPADSLFDAVRKHDVGVFGIKPFAGNSLFRGDGSPGSPLAEDDDRRARLALRHILSNPAVTAPIPGLISTHQVDNAVAAVKERRKLDRAEKAELDRIGREMWANLPESYEWLKDWQYV